MREQLYCYGGTNHNALVDAAGDIVELYVKEDAPCSPLDETICSFGITLKKERYTKRIRQHPRHYWPVECYVLESITDREAEKFGWLS